MNKIYTPSLIALLITSVLLVFLYINDFLSYGYMLQIGVVILLLFFYILGSTYFLNKDNISPTKSLVNHLVVSMLFSVLFFSCFLYFYFVYETFDWSELTALLSSYVLFKMALLMQLFFVSREA